ncbi:TPA: hypothetical protein HH295_06960 [Xanthomonas vasicola pv. zeae]|uniref:hypothetical protein n=1 Tax=Xanthomonas vasicola TaxID=56459 RepID=UPI00139017D8|nr:hypothetical protein [Xanthomonas vasicola]MBV6745418.1 hypothetical protein [Xanthomonas vasicola pv. vasculorum NCPPB 890]MBV6890821.1 hypothetical protein [Xanthomonas vasicola pv. vasculorum]MBV7306432.1 hypothetical protein [Xanthomonas vasicola pv. vasculorum]MDO6935798.1 hypothetical protein [Xanthomonas vasicola]MDO6939690.1 hypothetical protein [Xanthomonas vasicola]
MSHVASMMKPAPPAGEQHSTLVRDAQFFGVIHSARTTPVSRLRSGPKALGQPQATPTWPRAALTTPVQGT